MGVRTKINKASDLLFKLADLKKLCARLKTFKIY